MSEKRGNTVLIIDDEPDVIAYLQTALEDNGYRVFAATRASQGLVIAEKHHPSVICLDIVMPGQTGVSLYRTFREHAELKSVPIIIISGMTPAQKSSSFDLIRSQKKATVIPDPDAFIEKPIKLASFLSTIREYIQ